MNLKRLSLSEWNVMSAEAHKLCFVEIRDPNLNTCDFALLVTDENDEPVAYSTVIEMDAKTAYMQHGGAFPKFQGSTKVARAYHLMIAYIKEGYLRISTRIRNINTAMLKLALSADLIVNGIDILEGETFLNLSWGKE